MSIKKFLVNYIQIESVSDRYDRDTDIKVPIPIGVFDTFEEAHEFRLWIFQEIEASKRNRKKKIAEEIARLELEWSRAAKIYEGCKPDRFDNWFTDETRYNNDLKEIGAPTDIPGKLARIQYCINKYKGDKVLIDQLVKMGYYKHLELIPDHGYVPSETTKKPDDYEIEEIPYGEEAYEYNV